jgi:hypothetical protein
MITVCWENASASNAQQRGWAQGAVEGGDTLAARRGTKREVVQVREAIAKEINTLPEAAQ